MRERRLVLAMALSLAAVAQAARPSFAEDRPAAAASDSALATVAQRLAVQLSASPAGAVVVAAPLKSDDAAPRAAELGAKLTSLVAGAIGRGSGARAEPATLASARAAGQRAGAVVYLEPEIAKGELRVSGDVYAVPHNAWDRVRQPEPPPSVHAFASARVDAEVRGYLAPIPLTAGKIQRGATDDKDLVAIACGDVDDDGALELVTVGRRRIAVGRVRAGRFVPLFAAAWADLSPVAGAPLREPIAGVALLGGRGADAAFDVGLTDRARGARLGPELRPRAAISGVPFSTGGGDACAQYAANRPIPQVARCAEKDLAPDPSLAAAPFDAIATAAIVGRDGKARAFTAARDPASGELKLRAGAAAASIASAGAQVAIADLDGDGDPEIVMGADVLVPADDALVVSTWHPGSPVRERIRLAVPGGVRAVAACPPDGPGPAAIVVATAGEVWIVR